MREIIIAFFILSALALPCLSLAADAATSTQGSFIDSLFKAFKSNITIPLDQNTSVQIPTPDKALKDASPKLQKVNADVRNETGLDLAKFIGWSTKILALVFQTLIDLLQNVSKSLNGTSQ